MVVSRRLFLGSAAAVSGSIATGLAVPQAVAHTRGNEPTYPELLLRSDDARYTEMVSRGFNQRFIGSPETAQMVYTPEQVERAVTKAVRENRQIAVRSGGHCFAGLVDDPQVRALIDVSGMKRVYYDAAMRAFAVESGVTVGELYRELYLGWKVTVPAGVCPSVGVGGHVSGGGYGPLSRKHGLAVDHLHAVEVVVVDRTGQARTVVATRDDNDPNRDLWWAHTGGGGGNFGVVTKFWFRTPGATGDDPGKLLPQPPARLLSSWVIWPWEGLTEAGFTRMVRNHGAWHAANSGADSVYAGMHSSLHLNRKSVGSIILEIRMDGTLPNAQRLLDDYIAAVSEGVGVAPTAGTWEGLWLANSVDQWFDPTGANRGECKGSNLRKPLDANQIHTTYNALVDPVRQGQGKVYIAAYGGRINTVAPTATAVAQRDSLFKLCIAAQWVDPAEDTAQALWVKELYRDVHATTGGVPVTNHAQDGCYINYPDVDVRNPAWNTSGVPWHTLYYKENYPKLQRIKAKYDPRNVFHHTLSIQPPS